MILNVIQDIFGVFIILIHDDLFKFSSRTHVSKVGTQLTPTDYRK